MTKKRRLDVILNEKMVEIFDELDKIDGDSKSEIFRKAILTYYYIKKQTSERSQFLLMSKDSQEVKEIVWEIP